MREGAATATAFGTGALVVGAVVLFAMLEGRSAPPGVTEAEAGTAPESAPVSPVETVAGTAEPPPADRAVIAPAAATDSILARGRRVYDEQRCAACHSIAGQGSPRVPLDGVANRISREEIELWIVDPQAMRPGVRKPSYGHLPRNEIEAMVAYMETLTGPR